MYLCSFILHLLLRIIDLYLSLLYSSNLPAFLLFLVFSIALEDLQPRYKQRTPPPPPPHAVCVLQPLICGRPVLHEKVRLTGPSAEFSHSVQ